MRTRPSLTALFCIAFSCITACSDSDSNSSADDAFHPTEIVDLGALVTEDLPEQVWGKAVLRDNGYTDQNSFNVITWEQEFAGGVVSGSNSFYTIFNHGGPHVDAPNHIGFENGLDGYSVDVFSGPLKAFDVSDFPAGRTVGIDFFSEREIAPGDIVLIYTNYVPPVGDDDYPSTTSLTRQAAEYLANVPVRAIGTDAWSLYSYDETRLAEADNALGRVAPIHEVFLSRGIPIYEQLFNVNKLLDKERMFFVGVPLNIENGDGMIVRPVVFVY